MDQERKQVAETRLAEAFARDALADTRDTYRQRLRSLRADHPAAFERALRHYQDEVLPALAGDAEPVATWIDYGLWLAELTAPGRLMSVSEAGRAAPYHAPYVAGHLLLHIPDDGQAPALALMLPASPSPAQQATCDLLIAGRVSLDG